MLPEGPVHVVVLDRGRELSGVVHDGESWAAAARRTCASMHTEPEPADLSGEVKRFVVDHDTRIAIRAMTRGDLADVVAWRSDEEVVRWWTPGELTDRSTMEQKYAERIDGMSPTRMWVVEVNGRSVGFVQDYRIGDYPDYAVLGPDPDAIGVDYAIGAEPGAARGWVSGCCGPGCSGRGPGSRRRRPSSRHPTTATPPRCGCWPRRDSPRGCGSTSRSRTARSTTMVGCTLDVRRVVG